MRLTPDDFQARDSKYSHLSSLNIRDCDLASGCFGGKTLVHVVGDGTEKDKLVRMRDLRKGLRVRCRGGMIATVMCVIKIN